MYNTTVCAGMDDSYMIFMLFYDIAQSPDKHTPT